jgi:hypothetical protein
MTLQRIDATLPADLPAYEKVKHWIEKPPQNSRVITFTPEDCQLIIDNLPGNSRPRKAGKIKIYAADMKAGRWALNGETICFTDSGRLGNGQNRMNACVLANAPFTSHVVFGIPDRYFALMDRGKNRDPADVLTIAGIPNASQMAAAIKWAERLAHDAKSRDTLEPRVVLDLAKRVYEPGGMQERLAEARTIYGTTKHPVGLVAAILWHANAKNQRKAAEFARAWEARGVVRRGRSGAQIAGLIKALDDLASVSSGRVHDTLRAAWTVMAWNAFLAGKRMTVKSYSWVPTDEFPEIEAA